MKIALDHDSTLAATATTALDIIHGNTTHGISYDDIESWDWGLEKYGTARYLSALWHAWTLRPREVPPMEHGLEHTVAELRANHIVDIVTAHPDHLGISDGKRDWLEINGIWYDDFRVVEPETSKAVMDYDIYIDDKPALPVEVNKHAPNAAVYLIDQPYNQDAPGEYLRVDTVAEAVERINDSGVRHE